MKNQMKLLPCPRFDEIEIRGNKQTEPQRQRRRSTILTLVEQLYMIKDNCRLQDNKVTNWKWKVVPVQRQ
ncbi:hypothetical protein CCACVL1_24024 [Corchorus capsularis]|uniref:Uncharacterized protein n=1 Tax=Corchorus capsularis TaxID=210143 RepID=A0A1R3GR84_COCAP|nr:hypothetical protein CCACVL1_24024 [Corchorus capsularis]